MLRVTFIALIGFAISLSLGCPDNTPGSKKGPKIQKDSCYQSCQRTYDSCVNAGGELPGCTRDFNDCETDCN